MAHVLLTSAAPANDPDWPYPYDELHRMERSAREDKYGIHQTTDDPEEADIILFIENSGTIKHYFRLQENVYYQEHSEKCFLFTRDDLPIPFLPGIYPSIPQRWHKKQRTRSGSYLNAFDDNFLRTPSDSEGFEYLYSFVGQKSTHPLRQQIFKLDHPDQFVFDTSEYWPYGELPDSTREELEQQYVDVAHQSRFVLCPRGIGTSSIRLFETLRMGRAPVIISDAWVPPDGPDWESFSIRVPEDDILDLPSRLERRAEEAEAMGVRARQAWKDWFSEEAAFHRYTEWCLDIMNERKLPERLLRFSVIPQLLYPLYFRALMRTLLPSWVNEKLR
jgi:hypothetical protein